MSISGLAALKQRWSGPEERVRVTKTASPTTVVGRTYSGWLSAGVPAAGVAPTTSVVPTRATTGALGQVNPTGTRRILRAIFNWLPNTGGLLTLADRLVHSGGLSGTTTGAQTTNLPTATLTRQTSGVGVMAALEIYTAVGTTGTTATVSYTNTVPTAGQTSPAATFGGTGFATSGRFIVLPLAVGDVGVTAVASVTLAASTVSAAGNFGVTLFYPLVSIPMDHDGRPYLGNGFDNEVQSLYGFGSWFPIVETDACIFNIVHTVNTTYGVLNGEFHLAED